MANQASKARSHSRAPTNAPAPISTSDAVVHSEPNTADAGGVAVRPPGTSEPGGTNSLDTSKSSEAAKAGAGDAASAAAAPAWAQLSKDEFKVAYPLTFAFLSNVDRDVASSASSLRVTSKVAGFRRGGMAHSAVGTDFNPGELTPDQIEAFLAEPMLTVEIA